MEKPTQTPQKQPERQKSPEQRLADPIVVRAREVVGSFEEHVHDTEEWSEATIEERAKQYEQKVRHGERISLFELYDHNMDIDRREVVRILAASKKDAQGNPEFTDAERSEIIAAQLKVTVYENLSSTLETYMHLFDTYSDLKAEGSAGALGEQEVVAIAHLTGVQTLAEERVELASKIRTEQDPAQKKALQQKALVIDRELVKYLVCQDPEVPGSNPGGILPIHKQLLYMLSNQYTSILEAYKGRVKGVDAGAIRSKLRGVQQEIVRAYPNVPEGSITEDQVLPILKARGYKTIEEYRRDVAIVERLTVDYNLLKKQAQQNVEKLSQLTDALGDFHVERSTLATIRHHFDQQYALEGAEKPATGSTPAEVTEEMQRHLEMQQTAPVLALEEHLKRVDEGVLRVGFEENAENLYNERGRIFMARIAQYIASLETSWIPDVPGAGGAVRDLAKDAILDGGLYDALGWPRDEDGRPKEYKDLTKEEKEKLSNNQNSIKKAIERFREKKSLQKVSTSVRAAKKLISSRRFNSENMLGEGPIDPASLPEDVVTENNLDPLVSKYGEAVVTKMCFVQLQENWDAYSADYGELLTEFSSVVGTHLDVERYITEFAKGQTGISLLLLSLAGAGLLGGGAFLFGASRSGRALLHGGMRAGGYILRQTGRGISGAYRLSSRAFFWMYRTAAQAGRAVAASRTMEQLTRMRYLQRERQIAALLENSRAGRFVSRLNFVRNVRVVRGASTTFKYGSYALIPAVGAYEAYLTHERVKSAEGNKRLQDEYATGYTTAALETAGYGAAALLSTGPQIILSGPVYYAGNYSRARSEVKAGWEREVADWAREFDQPGLMNQLSEATLANAVEAGGGGALKPRIYLPSQPDQEEAVETIERAMRGSRQRILEAYFRKNLLLPEGTSAEVVEKVVRWKMNYMRLATHGGYDQTYTYVYEEADTYAEMMMQYEEMKKKGADTTVPYVLEDGSEHILDFSQLGATGIDRSKLLYLVGEYKRHIRPIQELTLFNALGQIAEERKPFERAAARKQAKDTVRVMILSKLSHTVYKHGGKIDTIDWPGVDFWPVAAGDTYAKNIMRSYYAEKIRSNVDALVQKVLKGDLQPEEYEKALNTAASQMEDFDNAEDNNLVQKLFDAALAYFGDRKDEAGSPAVDPLQALILGQ